MAKLVEFEGQDTLKMQLVVAKLDGCRMIANVATHTDVIYDGYYITVLGTYAAITAKIEEALAEQVQ
jgi:hypothetical protein